MAEDYSSVTAFPNTQRFTLSSSINDLTEIKLPKGGRKISILFEDNVGKFTHTGTDDAAIGTDYFTTPKDTALEIVYGVGISASDPLSVYVTSATASTVVCVILEGKVDLEDKT